MKKNYRRGLASLLLCFLIPLAAVGAVAETSAPPKKGAESASAGVKSTFESPDFAYPATVRDDAQKVYSSAMRSGKPLEALKAAMEMAVADRLTSSDSVAVTLGRYREIAEKFAAPYSSMASLLEASILASLYQSSPYVFDSRVLPLESRDAEPLLWSGDQLRDAVASLSESALAARDVLAGRPIGDLAYILTSTADADRFGMSALDFAVYRILDITAGCGIDRRPNSRLPFKAVGGSAAVECGDSRYRLLAPDRLLDMLVASDSQRLPAAAGALCEARLRRLTYASTIGTDSATSESFATPAAMRLLADYPVGNEWRPYVVCRLYEMGQFGDDTLAKRAALYDFLKGEASSSADAKAKSYLNDVCSRMLTPSYRAESVGQWLPSKGGDVAFKLTNMSRAYVLLVPVSSSFAESDNPRVSGISPSGKIRVLAERSAVVDKPVEFIDTVSSGSLPAGYYALVVSTTPDLSGIPSEVGRQAASLVNVSDLSMFASDAAPVDVEAGKSQRVGKYLYVVDATDNSPREGVKVRFVNTAYKSTGTTELLTDRNGCVTAPYDNFKATAVSRNSRFVWSTSKGYYYSSEPQRLTADLLTDLALYHPGDTLRCVAVLSALRDARLAPKSDERIGISLYNVNGECVASDTVVSDRTGRAVAALRIPAEGLTGRFTLRAVSGSDQIGSTSVEVAEYKAPTFGVTLDEPDVAASGGGDVVTFSGAVASYSGMPLADSKVEISISYHPWWRPWMINAPSASEYAASAVAGADGRFKVELGLSADDYSVYSMGSFSVTATATSPAGETNSSAVRRFTLGEGRRIEPFASDKIEVKGDSVVIPVKVTDILSRPVSARVGYRFVPASGSASTVSQLAGECSTPALSLAASALPSGTYRLQLVLAEGCKDSKGKWIPDTLATDVTVWRPTDKCPPAATPLWVPVADVYAAPGKEMAEVTVGAGYPGERVYCEISRGNGIIERHWLSPDGKNVKVKVDVPAGEGTAEVRFFGMHDLEQAKSRVTVYPAEMLRKSQFEVVTFRDRLTPGNQESWKFRFVAGYPGDMKPQGDAAVIAVLSNAALDAITPFKWNYVPRRLTAVSRPGNISLPYMRSASAYGYLSRGNVKDLSFGALDLPDFNFWGYSAYQRRIMIRGRGVQYKMAATSGSIDGAVVTESMSSYASANMVMNDMAAPKMESAEESAMDVAEVESPATADEPAAPEYRAMEMPLAFFRPLLSTDSEGIAEIDFTVPDFNTTWRLQIVGYNDDMESAGVDMSAIASKPVMISTQMPRFLLTGDDARISATYFNNSGEPIDADALIEVFDPESGAVLAFTSTGRVALDENASGVVTVNFRVPDNLSSVGVRSVVRSEAGSDGEQSLLAILPSSTPVRDATLFYLTPGESGASVEIPQLKASDLVTLNYCASPSWYVLTSLSGVLTPQSESALESAMSLYANCVGGGLMSRYPQLAAGVARIADSESGMRSPLEGAGSLKVQSLAATPWVNNAANESQRVASLSSLTDPAGVKAAIGECVARLRNSANSDGSWSWVKGMPPSLWITENVISTLGRLNASGYLPDDQSLRKMLAAGVAYTDSEEGRIYSETVARDKGSYPLASEIDYFYIRRGCGAGAPKGDLARMQADMLRRLPSEWRDLSLMRKAEASILLADAGKSALAADILESVRQMGSYKDSKGMWFDVTSEWGSPSPLLLTARCLEAFSVVDPSSDCIERMAQYLVLSRQTSDWNLELGHSGIADVVGAMVGAESKWFDVDSSAAPEIVIGGRPVSLPEGEAITGNVYLSLDPSSVSGQTLEIRRQGEGPAWGGVMAQYVAPAADVKAYGPEQLQISKSLLPIESGADGVAAGKSTQSFRKGDRVRVTLTVVADRDIDYLLIHDALGAWMQPDGQLTQYMMQGGMMMMRETTLSAMNFYIMRLPKGKHMITYDVYADRDGEYSTGIATAQSQYYPMMTAHSAGCVVNVE